MDKIDSAIRTLESCKRLMETITHSFDYESAVDNAKRNPEEVEEWAKSAIMQDREYLVVVDAVRDYLLKYAKNCNLNRSLKRLFMQSEKNCTVLLQVHPHVLEYIMKVGISK